MSREAQKEALLKAIKIAGSQTALAEDIGTSQQNISNWLKTGFIKPEFVIPIEIAVETKVSRHDLYPEIYPISKSSVTRSSVQNGKTLDQ